MYSIFSFIQLLRLSGLNGKIVNESIGIEITKRSKRNECSDAIEFYLTWVRLRTKNRNKLNFNFLPSLLCFIGRKKYPLICQSSQLNFKPVVI